MRSLDSLRLKLSKHLVINLSPRKKMNIICAMSEKLRKLPCSGILPLHLTYIHKLAENINRKLILVLISKVDRNPETEH